MKKTPRLTRLALALLVPLALVGCGSSPDPAGPATSGYVASETEQVFKQIVATLCADVMEGRDAGTRGIDIARDYLVYQYAKAGLEPGFIVDGRWSYTQEFQLGIGRDAEGNVINAPISNIGGILPGVGDLADEVVIIGAHYDHIGYGDIGSRAPDRRGHIHPGADDNASGTAGLVILARRLANYARAHPDTPRRTILFTSFAGEERGLHGSRFETENAESWPFEIEDISGMINMDMIGRLRERLIVYTAETGAQLADWINQANADNGSPIVVSLETDAPGGSDHTSFIRVGVPAVFFFTGLHADYHTPDDTPDKLNNEGAAQVLELVGDVLIRTATDPEKLTFVSPPLRPFMGVRPGDAAEGGGLVISRVFGDTPAAAAGMQSGDVLVRFGDRAIDSPRDLSVALRESEAGQEVALLVLRDGETVELTIELGGR
jgi:hypothetical protein